MKPTYGEFRDWATKHDWLLLNTGRCTQPEMEEAIWLTPTGAKIRVFHHKDTDQITSLRQMDDGY